MEHLEAQVGEHLLLQLPVLGGDRPHTQFVRFLDQGADHEDLPTRRHLASNKLVGLLPLVGGDHLGLHRQPPGGHLAQLDDVHVAVDGQRQRARDRGRRHGQEVGHGPGLEAQALALGHPEAVLLVDHHQPEVVEHDVVLDERVGAHHQGILAGRQPLEDLPPGPGPGAAQQQARRQAVGGEQRLQGHIVLAGQDLRRGHDHALEAGAAGHQRRHGGHRRLAAAHVALEQAVHRPGLGEIGEHLVGGLALAVGQAEGEARRIRAGQLDVVGDDHPGRAEPAPPGAVRRHLDEEELLEGETLPGGRRQVLAVGEVDLAERIPHRHQSLGLTDLWGKSIGHQLGDGEDAADQGPEVLGGDPVGLRVHGRQAADVLGVRAHPLEPGVLEGEPVKAADHLPVHQDLHPGPQLLGEIRLVEPDGADPAAPVLQGGLHQRHPPLRAGMAAHLPDPDAGRLHLARAQLPERHQIAGVLVAAGQVQEQVGDGRDPQPAQPLTLRGAHARELRDRGLRPAGARKLHDPAHLPALGVGHVGHPGKL